MASITKVEGRLVVQMLGDVVSRNPLEVACGHVSVLNAFASINGPTNIFSSLGRWKRASEIRAFIQATEVDPGHLVIIDEQLCRAMIAIDSPIIHELRADFKKKLIEFYEACKTIRVYEFTLVQAQIKSPSTALKSFSDEIKPLTVENLADRMSAALSQAMAEMGGAPGCKRDPDVDQFLEVDSRFKAMAAGLEPYQAFFAAAEGLKKVYAKEKSRMYGVDKYIFDHNAICQIHSKLNEYIASNQGQQPSSLVGIAVRAVGVCEALFELVDVSSTVVDGAIVKLIAIQAEAAISHAKERNAKSSQLVAAFSELDEIFEKNVAVVESRRNEVLSTAQQLVASGAFSYYGEGVNGLGGGGYNADKGEGAGQATSLGIYAPS